jgi:hypothetical protein
MKRIVALLVFLMAAHMFPAERIILKDAESIDFLEKMESHDYFFKKIMGVDIDDEKNLYFLDAHLCTILRVDGKTGKLINSISRRGQGPGEVHFPFGIRVRNNMVFVTDAGFSGVKIFEKNGKLVKEFKTKSSALHFHLDVNKKNQIYVKQGSSDGSPNISVYNINGKLLRELVKFPVKPGDRRGHLLNSQFVFKLDKEENLVVVFLLKKIIKKFNGKGELLWERKIQNEVYDKFKTDSKISFKPNGAIYFSTSIFGMDIDDNNNIVVGHLGGGIVYDEHGHVIHLIEFDPPGQLNQFLLFDHKLLHIIILGRRINIFDFNLEEQK